jgi:uncharacterized repeat protein (TIGR01451 family)/LPXTG-motif cell wall-anchored protein
MQIQTPYLDWRRNIIVATCSAIILLFTLIILAKNTPIAQAQGTLRVDLVKELQGSNTVRVGDYLTFTIRIENTGTISITGLPVIDNYDAEIIQFERAIPAPNFKAQGELRWTNLTTNTMLGPLAPGETHIITTVFRAIAPKPATVNAAETGTLQGYNGQQGEGDKDQAEGETKGGKVVLTKQLAPNQSPASGQLITFTIRVENQGGADVLSVPLVDDYDTEYLQFAQSSPRPNKIDPANGILEWNNLLPSMGLNRLLPNQVITVTTVFTALKSVDNQVVNVAHLGEVADEFGNQVEAPRQDAVPIQIVAGPDEPQPTATPRPQSNQPRNTPTPQPEATPEITSVPELTPTPEIAITEEPTPEGAIPDQPTPEITTTSELSQTTELTSTIDIEPTPQPSSLPRTGNSSNIVWIFAVSLSLLVAGFAVRIRRSRG